MSKSTRAMKALKSSVANGEFKSILNLQKIPEKAKVKDSSSLNYLMSNKTSHNNNMTIVPCLNRTLFG